MARAMDPAQHILIVDDDREIRELLSGFLDKHGFRTTAVGDGKEMDVALAGDRFDLMILDLMLPGEDGLSLCRRVRASLDLPIVMLTAVGEETDRIVGLELGADDYMPKPFNPRELLARIRAVLRRLGAGGPAAGTTAAEDGAPAGETEAVETAVFAGWQVDLGRRELRDPDGVLVPLTSGEFGLLHAFIDHAGRVLSRDQLLDLTRGRTAGPFDRAVDVQLSRLRRKIEADPKDPQLIKTIRGDGYILTVPVTRS